MLAKTQHQLDFMIDNIRPLSDAVQAYVSFPSLRTDVLTCDSYDDFNSMKYQKIIFEADK